MWDLSAITDRVLIYSGLAPEKPGSPDVVIFNLENRLFCFIEMHISPNDMQGIVSKIFIALSVCGIGKVFYHASQKSASKLAKLSVNLDCNRIRVSLLQFTKPDERAVSALTNFFSQIVLFAKSHKIRMKDHHVPCMRNAMW